MINKTTSAWDTNPFIKAPTACINSLLCSVIEGFKYKEKKMESPKFTELRENREGKIISEDTRIF